MAASSEVARYEPIPLLDFIPALSPKLARPTHLAPIAEAFERSMREPVRVFGTTPPRHGKTEMMKHAIVHRLLTNPAARICYVSYSASFARKRSREIRKLYLRAGGKLEKGARLVSDWRTGVGDGGLWVTSVGGSVTGEGFDLIVVDDPIKGRAIAESEVEREKLWEYFVNDLETRCEPGGSVVVIHTRWTVDDLGGRLLARGDYLPIHLPAINDNGQALWPERWTLEELRKVEVRIGAYSWASLYMGRPFSKGGRVFEGLQLVEFADVPENLRKSIGVDLAYTKKTHADYSVLVLLGIDDATERIYVLDVVRSQERAPTFAEKIGQVQAANDNASATWYYAGAEKGIADFLDTLGVGIDARPATQDKHARAQPVAAAWNAKRVFIVKNSRWADAFAAELAAFTGVADLHDDQVDALAAAFDAAEQPSWVQGVRKRLQRKGAA